MPTAQMTRLLRRCHTRQVHDWRQRANCGPDTAHLFFPPEEKEGPADRQYREAGARALCLYCPVKDDCVTSLATVLDVSVDDAVRGTWGGCTPKDREDEVQAGVGRFAVSAQRRKIPGGGAPKINMRALERYVAAGLSTMEMARALGVTERSVQRARDRLARQGKGKGNR